MTKPPMSKSKKQEDKPESEDIIIERMNKALKKMMDTPPETHKEMIERRRGGAKLLRKTTKKTERTNHE